MAGASPSGWQAEFGDQPGLPPTIVAVDKQNQQLLLLEHKSPLAVVGRYACTTGQIPGDKQDEGDKKTPEGVYFVKRHIRDGLDFALYGGIAYTLNYPNPMDILRRKSGHGIWVHGRGHAIVPLETQGCVAMNNSDLITIGGTLQPGTPVVLAQRIDPAAPQTTEGKKIAAAVLDMTREWAEAWGSRDATMFGYYDADAYTQSRSGSFSSLVSTKRRLFDSLPWIINWIDDVHVMQGPGYWVSWFKQYYRAPNLTVQGERRLYWHKAADGNLRIAGMEWDRRNMNLEERYLQTRKADILRFVEGWRTAWESANLEGYAASYLRTAVQGERTGADAIRAYKEEVWALSKPQAVKLSDVTIDINGQGLSVQMKQFYASQDGYSDTGIKTLFLYPEGQSWRIASEDWRAL